MKKGSGFVGDLDQEQEQALVAFKQELAPMALDPQRYDDYFYLRFLRARKFDLEKSLLMVRNFFQWRTEFGTDQIFSYEFPEVTEMKKFYPHGYHKTDRQGRPIYIECLGKLDLKQLFDLTNTDRMIKYYVREYERTLLVRLPACSTAAGRKIEQSLTILDLEGLSMKLMSKQTYDFVKIASSIAQDYYPEMLGQMFIINAPTLFSMVWGTIKKFVDEKTRNKIQILSTKYQSALLELVDPENLPQFLGGTCKCPQGCLNSSAGPWNPKCLRCDATGELIVPRDEEEEAKEAPVIPSFAPEILQDSADSREDSDQDDLREEDVREILEYVTVRSAAFKT